MTQEQANKIFLTELGQQLDMIYVTSDDMPFIRMIEAINHAEELGNTIVEKWYPEEATDLPL